MRKLRARPDVDQSLTHVVPLVARNNATGWPDVVEPRLARHLVDCHMVAFYERRPQKTVLAFQQHWLAQLVAHATTHSAWWRHRLGSLRNKESLRLDDLPLMSRAGYRASIEQAGGPLLLPEGHGKAVPNSTSGSSGIPLTFYTSGMDGRMNSAHYFQNRICQGIDSSQLVVRFNNTLDEHQGAHVTTPPNVLLDRASEFQRRTPQFTVEEHARWLAEVKPVYVIANPTLLSGIMDVYERGDLAPPAIQKLLTVAETVPPGFRQRAREVLGARTVDRYSCEEAGPIAFQCPVSDDHYHVSSTKVVVELLDESGRPVSPGEIGQVFVTNLHNYASPVIRYELGDLASWLPHCVCGHSHPVLTRLLGRKRFLVRLRSGEHKFVSIIAKHWLSVAPFKESRIVQVSEDLIRAECVLDRPVSPQERRNLIKMLQREIDPGLKYEVVQLDRIDWGSTYKRQDVVSLI